MQKIGAHVSIAGGLVNAISNAQQIGAAALQFFAGSPRTWARQLFSTDQVTAFNQQVEKHDLRPVFIHALYLINLASENPDTLRKSMESLSIDLQNSELINAEGVIVHIGANADFPAIKSDVVSRIDTLLNQAPNATLMLENSAGQKGKIGTLEQLHDLMIDLQHPRVKICIDTAHLHAAGYNLSDISSIDALIDKLKTLKLLSHVVCIHLNELKSAFDSRHDVHANLGEGTIGLPGLSYFVSHPAFQDIPLILEVPGHDPKAKGPDIQNIQTAKSLVKSWK